MKVTHRSLDPAPGARDRVRLTVGVHVDRFQRSCEYWFEFPRSLAADVSEREDSIAVLLVPLASYFGEALILEGPVDARLLRNLHAASQVWSQWYPECSVVDFIVPNRDRALSPAVPRSMACFSGGVDSYHTLIRHREVVVGDGSLPVQDLLTVAGFNSPMSGFETMRQIIGRVADEHGCRHIPVLTNVRYGDHAFATPYSQTEWMVKLAHGALLAAIGQMFSTVLSEMLIPASAAYSDGDAFHPWGSSVVVDPLFSSSGLRIVHDGAGASRIDKIRTIAASTSLDALHVCWRDWELGNCSRCHKCLRTMAELDVSGFWGLGAFDWSLYSMDALGGLVIPKDTMIYFDDVQCVAEEQGRGDLVRAIQQAKRRTPLRQSLANLQRRTRSVSRRSTRRRFG